MKVIMMVCTKTNCSRQICHFGPENFGPHNFGLALRIFLKFCRMKGANKCTKILLVLFQERCSFGTIWSF